MPYSRVLPSMVNACIVLCLRRRSQGADTGGAFRRHLAVQAHGLRQKQQGIIVLSSVAIRSESPSATKYHAQDQYIA